MRRGAVAAGAIALLVLAACVGCGLVVGLEPAGARDDADRLGRVERT